MSRAAIAYVSRKHHHHSDIVASLQHKYEVQELALPIDEGECTRKDTLLADLAGLDLLIIYLSAETKVSGCIHFLVFEATKREIRIVGIWLEDASSSDMPKAIDEWADSVTCYPSDLNETLTDEDSTWLDPNGNKIDKRKIKKHICG